MLGHISRLLAVEVDATVAAPKVWALAQTSLVHTRPPAQWAFAGWFRLFFFRWLLRAHPEGVGLSAQKVGEYALGPLLVGYATELPAVEAWVALVTHQYGAHGGP